MQRLVCAPRQLWEGSSLHNSRLSASSCPHQSDTQEVSSSKIQKMELTEASEPRSMSGGECLMTGEEPPP